MLHTIISLVVPYISSSTHILSHLSTHAHTHTHAELNSHSLVEGQGRRYATWYAYLALLPAPLQASTLASRTFGRKSSTMSSCLVFLPVFTTQYPTRIPCCCQYYRSVSPYSSIAKLSFLPCLHIIPFKPYTCTSRTLHNITQHTIPRSAAQKHHFHHNRTLIVSAFIAHPLPWTSYRVV